MNKVFANAGSFWNWIVISSSDPNSVALTVKGFVSLGVVQAVFGVLPLLGVHLSFDLNGLGDQLYSVTYAALNAVSAIAGVYGAGRKLVLFFFPANA